MEFLDYKEFVAVLRESHVVAREIGDLVRFNVEATTKPSGSVHRLIIAPPGFEPAPGASAVASERRLAAARERMPEILDSLIHTARLTEVAIIPAGRWRTVMDLVAYELASDESWLDVDAEASLHLNTRDPLLLNPPDLHILRTLAGALLNAIDGANEPDPGQDLTIVSAGASMVFELGAAGVVRVTCANASVADHLAAVV